MARHHERLIADAQAAVATAGQPTRPDPDPMLPQEIDSFLRGFGLNARQVRLIRDRWQDDNGKAYSSGYDTGFGDGSAAYDI
jgi:hypothetical protein